MSYNEIGQGWITQDYAAVTVLSTPDAFSRRLLETATEESAVVLVPRAVSRQRLSEFYQVNSGQLRHFADDKALARESYRLRELNGSTLFQQTRAAVGKIFGNVSMGPGEFPIQLTIASNQSRFAVRDDSIGQIVRIEEDQLTATTLSKFLNAYSPLAAEQRPLFIIETHDENSAIEDRVRQLPDEFSLLRFGDHSGLERLIFERLPSRSLSEFVDQYAENTFSSIARLSVDQLSGELPEDAPFSTVVAARLCHIRASALQLGKFGTLDAARSLHELLEQNRMRLDGAEAPVLLAGKLFTNLWLLYCRDGGRELFDNSMAIANALEDPLIEAHCLRLINVVEPHSSFTEHCSRKAAQLFFERGAIDHANFCLNNALVGRFYSFDPSANDFAEAIETSAANIKGFRGLSIMMNNAGVAHLIEGDYAGAIEWLERAGKQPAWPLHRFGIEVNLLIAKFLEGENPEPAELLKLARAASRQIDHRYRYQLANILLNLALFAKAHPDCAAEITAILSEPDLLNDPAVTRDHTTLVQLTNRLGLSDHVATAHPGLRGHFIDRHGFVPIFHHAWL